MCDDVSRVAARQTCQSLEMINQAVIGAWS